MLKGTQYTSAVLSNTGKAFATSADGTLREILEGQVLRAIELPGSVNGCALSRSGKLLLSAFGGNSGATSGAVVGVRVPLTQPPELQVTPGHAGAITRVQMNHEESLLFTGGEDGLVMIWKISDREGRVKASGGFSNLCLLNPFWHILEYISENRQHAESYGKAIHEPEILETTSGKIF